MTTERLSGADAWYLYLEGPTVHLHVTGVFILDASDVPGGLSFERLSEVVAERIHLLPSFRKRLVEVPLTIDHPVFVEDPDFNLQDHLHHLGLTDGVSAQELSRTIGTIASTPLRRDRPLWDLVVIEGLDNGCAAVVIKLHHCLVDGVSGLDLIAHLLDLEPSPPTVTPDTPRPPPQAVPGSVRSAASATLNRLTHPLRPARALAGVVTTVGKIAATSLRRRLSGAQTAAHPLNAPRTMFNASLSSRRSVAFGNASLDDLQAVRHSYEVTINDAVLAACTQGLQRYLSKHGEVPELPLVCSVPVSMHDRSDRDSVNQVSAMFVNLPVDIADPIEQLRLIHRGTNDAKDVQRSVGADIISDVVELIPGSLFQTATDLYSKLQLANRMSPVHNLIVSNVMGPTMQLYLAGARVTAMYPFGPLMEGAGLNISVVSYNGEVNIGLTACPELVPGLDELLTEIMTSIEELGAAARLAAS